MGKLRKKRDTVLCGKGRSWRIWRVGAGRVGMIKIYNESLKELFIAEKNKQPWPGQM